MDGKAWGKQDGDQVEAIRHSKPAQVLRTEGSRIALPYQLQASAHGLRASAPGPSLLLLHSGMY